MQLNSVRRVIDHTSKKSNSPCKHAHAGRFRSCVSYSDDSETAVPILLVQAKEVRSGNIPHDPSSIPLDPGYLFFTFERTPSLLPPHSCLGEPSRRGHQDRHDPHLVRSTADVARRKHGLTGRTFGRPRRIGAEILSQIMIRAGEGISASCGITPSGLLTRPYTVSVVVAAAEGTIVGCTWKEWILLSTSVVQQAEPPVGLQRNEALFCCEC